MARVPSAPQKSVATAKRPRPTARKTTRIEPTAAARLARGPSRVMPASMSEKMNAEPPTSVPGSSFMARTRSAKLRRWCRFHESMPRPVLASTSRPRVPSRSVKGHASTSGTSASVRTRKSSGGRSFRKRRRSSSGSPRNALPSMSPRMPARTESFAS